jgi:hypothetical protein
MRFGEIGALALQAVSQFSSLTDIGVEVAGVHLVLATGDGVPARHLGAFLPVTLLKRVLLLRLPLSKFRARRVLGPRLGLSARLLDRVVEANSLVFALGEHVTYPSMLQLIGPRGTEGSLSRRQPPSAGVARRLSRNDTDSVSRSGEGLDADACRLRWGLHVERAARAIGKLGIQEGCSSRHLVN